MTVTGLSPATKACEVEYDPAKVSVTDLVSAVAKTQPLHGKAYSAGVRFKVAGLTDASAEKLAGNLKAAGLTGECDVKAGTVTLFVPPGDPITALLSAVLGSAALKPQ